MTARADEPLRTAGVHRPKVPARLNLSVARRCFVSCPGCYSLFGREDPDLDRLVASVEVFVRCGVHDVTISGGDPLTIRGLDHFLSALRTVGVRTIKLDTVGTTLVRSAHTVSYHAEPPLERRDVNTLLALIDQISIPLDGASNETVASFRKGRTRLFEETLEVLDALDRSETRVGVVINTVLHSRNQTEIDGIAELLENYRRVQLWNVFQYTPSDQAQGKANAIFLLSDQDFAKLQRAAAVAQAARRIKPSFWSNAERVGSYLLVNSDGEGWMPDRRGNTIRLGSVFHREEIVLQAWRGVFLAFHGESQSQ